ncbi:MAG: VOC family protein [Woeseia sp.]|nr:VOC family protein [Woeseia sp.]MBT8095943.1 VOC family protein [Woeseia sp.]NNE61088.1 VOC family protein [Woeseia sp.]NNL53769.1 VOC family protein [Woeseia sp.]
MIGYTTVGTNDLAKAAAFYDALFKPLGGKRFMDFDTFIAWSVDPRKPGFAITHPHNGEAASVGNGVMIALAVDSPEKVDEMHKLALELGGTDEGQAGPRGETFYAGYFRDLDGNKLNFFCVTKRAG